MIGMGVKNIANQSRKPYHRFSLLAHSISAFTAFLSYLVYVALTNNLFVASEYSGVSQSSNGLVAMAFFMLVILSIIVCSIPATWICLGIAKYFKFTKYWQFALLGLLAAVITAIIFTFILMPLRLDLVVEEVFKNELASSWNRVLAYINTISFLATFLAPAGIIAALTYRFVTNYIFRSAREIT